MKKHLIKGVFLLIYLIHILGCLWYAQIYANVFNYTNWIRTRNLENAPMFDKYAAAVYWACVTCTTVGYGDITPTNNFELFWTIVTMVFGIGTFSYFLSDLSS